MKTMIKNETINFLNARRIKVFSVLLFSLFCINNATAQFSENAKGKHNLGLGLNAGAVVGDYEDLYTSNIGLDVYYLYGISNHFFVGGSTGFAHYFGDEVNVVGIGDVDIDDESFIPLAGSVRFSPFNNFMIGADVGYAFALEEDSDGGFYASPRATYFISSKIPVYAGYRLIDFNGENLGSIQLGIGLRF